VRWIDGYFASLPPERFPNAVAILDHLFAGDLDERFELSLDVLAKGLAVTSER
jgi:TetR/AcrR family transcriptional regulator, tetracycline repressor protein